MMALRIAAALLAVNALVFLAGLQRGGDTQDMVRPSWLPPLWLRAAIPLVIAGGLWPGHRWAWWLAGVLCSFDVLVIGLASSMLIPTGYFTGEGSGIRAAHFGLLLGTWVARLILVLSKPARAAALADLTAHQR